MTERTIDLIDTYCANCEYAKDDMDGEPCRSCIEGYNNKLVVGFYTKRTDEENNNVNI